MRFCFHFIAVIGCLNQIYLRNKRRFTINFFYCFTDKSEYNESYGDCMVNTGKQSIQNTVAKIGSDTKLQTEQHSTTQHKKGDNDLQFNSGKKSRYSEKYNTTGNNSHWNRYRETVREIDKKRGWEKVRKTKHSEQHEHFTNRQISSYAKYGRLVVDTSSPALIYIDDVVNEWMNERTNQIDNEKQTAEWIVLKHLLVLFYFFFPCVIFVLFFFFNTSNICRHTKQNRGYINYIEINWCRVL